MLRSAGLEGEADNLTYVYDVSWSVLNKWCQVYVAKRAQEEINQLDEGLPKDSKNIPTCPAS